jgi:hypothetical protein
LFGAIRARHAAARSLPDGRLRPRTWGDGAFWLAG